MARDRAKGQQGQPEVMDALWISAANFRLPLSLHARNPQIGENLMAMRVQVVGQPHTPHKSQRMAASVIQVSASPVSSPIYPSTKR